MGLLPTNDSDFLGPSGPFFIMGRRSFEKTIVVNTRLNRAFEVIETYDAGIVLQGSEVKAVKEGRVNLSDSYCKIKNGEIFIKDLHIGPYPPAGIFNHEPKRDRKLLLKKNEIKRLYGKVNEKGMTIVPKRVYVKDGLVKVEIALCKGKKAIDRREDLKRKAMMREMERELKWRF